MVRFAFLYFAAPTIVRSAHAYATASALIDSVAASLRVTASLPVQVYRIAKTRRGRNAKP